MGTGFPAAASSRAARLEAAALVVLPVSAVLVVAFAVLVAARPGPVTGVRLRGGPTDQAAPSLRLEAAARGGDVERPLANAEVRVEAERGGDRASWSGVLDDEGSAHVELPAMPHAPGAIRLRAWLTGRESPVVDAAVAIDSAAWSRGAPRRGGWVDGRPGGGLVVRAAAERGVFAVPYADGLRVEVRRHGAPRAGVPLTVTGDGAEVEPRTAVTDARGRARFVVRPLDHGATVSIVAREENAEARLDLSPAIVPGALHAELVPGGVRVESPILRPRAYVALVTGGARLMGAAVALARDDRGGSSGLVVPRVLPAEGPLWAVVSSEPDLRSAATVGWPLRAAVVPEPETTFDVPDVIWFDGMAAAIRSEAARARRVRLFSAAFAAASLAVTTLLVLRRAWRSRVVLARHLAKAGSEGDDAARVMQSNAPGLAAAAALCLGVAALFAALFAAWR